MLGEALAAAHHLEGGLGRIVRRAGDAVLHRVGVHAVDLHLVAELVEGDRQRGLGHAVARQERLRAESRRLHPLGEVQERPRPDRLGAAAGDPQLAQIHGRQIPVLDALGDQPVGEVRRVGDRAAVLADLLEPDPRRASEVRGRQEHHRDVADERAEDEADQPHVVVEGQPAHADVVVVAVEARGAEEGAGVGDQVPVGDHHALGLAGRAAGELEEAEIVLAHGRQAGARGAALEGVFGVPDGHVDAAAADLADDLAVALHAEDRGGFRRADDVRQDVDVALGVLEARPRVDRHRHQPGDGGAEEGEHEFVRLGDDQGHPIALLQPAIDQEGGPAVGLRFHVLVGEVALLAVEADEAKAPTGASPQGAQGAHEGRAISHETRRTV